MKEADRKEVNRGRLVRGLSILSRLVELNGTPGKYRVTGVLAGVDYEDPYEDGISFDSIEDAIHHEINKLERNEIEPGTSRRIYLEGRA